MMSVGRWGCSGLHGLCPYPRGRRLAVLLEAAWGCGAGTRQGSLSPGAAQASCPASLGCEGCLCPSAGQIVAGGFCMCLGGNPPRVVAPGGLLGSYGVPSAWGAPRPLKTVVVGGLRRVPGIPGTQGWPRCCASAWLYGSAGPRVGAIARVARSFRLGYRSPMRHEPGSHVVPLAGVVHGGGGCVPFRPMAGGDVRRGASSLLEVTRSR